MKLLELLVGLEFFPRKWTEICQNPNGSLKCKGFFAVRDITIAGLAICEDQGSARITRTEYDVAKKLVNEGFTLWFADRPHVSDCILVETVYSDGTHRTGKALDWNHSDFIAYKIVPTWDNVESTGDYDVIHLMGAGWKVEDALSYGHVKLISFPPGGYHRANCGCFLDGSVSTTTHGATARDAIGSVHIQVTDQPTSVHAADLLDKASGHLKERAAQRDLEGERSMKACVEAFNAMFSKDLTVTEGWRFMELLKMSRSRHKFNADDFEDGAAYAALAGEEKSRES